MSPRDLFDAAKIASLVAISPTALQITPILPLGKVEPFKIILTATLKILFTSYIVYVVTNST